MSDQGETSKGPGRARLAVYRACRRGWDRGGRALAKSRAGTSEDRTAVRELVPSHAASLLPEQCVPDSWGPYVFVAPAACQEGCTQRLRANVKAVTLAATGTKPQVSFSDRTNRNGDSEK